MSALIWDRTAQSINTMADNGSYRVAILPNVGTQPHSPLAFGFGEVDGVIDITTITHGFLVQDGQYCVIESGTQVTPKLPLPLHEGAALQAVVFRIYRVGGSAWYSISTAPEMVYTVEGWGDALWANWDIDHEYDTDPHAASFSVSPLWTGLGDLVYESDKASTGDVSLFTAFGRPPFDPYGDEVFGAIYGAMLNTVVLEAAIGGAYVNASLPAIGGFAGSTTAGVYAELPNIIATAGDYGESFIAQNLPAAQGSARQVAVLDFEVGNYCYASLPAFSVPFEGKTIPANLPALRSIAGDFPAAVAQLPAIGGYAGDSLNGVYAELPAMRSRSNGQFAPVGIHGYVPINLRLAGHSVVIDPSHLRTAPLEFLLGVNGRAFGENSLVTEPLNLGLSVAFRVFANRTLVTEPFGFGLRLSESKLFRERPLQTEPLSLAMGGDMQAQAEAILQTMPLVFALGGRLGAAAIGRVFCMNAATGGTTEYTGYTFNSVAKIGGRYYGANEQGLFLLEGETDNGTPIAANFGFGQLDFGAAQMKTLSYCYLGTKAGQMRLTIDALVCGKPAQFSYPSRRHGETMRGVRFDLGRGMKSTYVMPTFSNIDGNDFEVDTVRFMAAGSSRRIQK